MNCLVTICSTGEVDVDPFRARTVIVAKQDTGYILTLERALTNGISRAILAANKGGMRGGKGYDWGLVVEKQISELTNAPCEERLCFVNPSSNRE